MSNDDTGIPLTPRQLFDRLDADASQTEGHLIDYTNYTNKQLLTIPLLLMGGSLVILLIWFALYGAPVGLGIEFTGGTEIVLTTPDSPDEIAASFDHAATSVTPVRSEANTYIVTFQHQNAQELTATAEQAGYTVTTVQSVSATFGDGSQRTALLGIAIAFAGMSVLIFAIFRTIVPSIAVVASAFGDIVVPLALMNIFGIDLTLGTVAGLLMLIGYSVDSDILLNNSVLRRSGDFYESTYRAMRTGVTMTLTSLSAMTVMTIAAHFVGIQLLASVGLILVFGLVTDLINTYLMNVSLLRWHKYEGVKR